MRELSAFFFFIVCKLNSKPAMGIMYKGSQIFWQIHKMVIAIILEI